MYNGFSIFSTTRHVSRSTEPGFRYFSEGPLISARASAEAKINKFQINLNSVQFKMRLKHKLQFSSVCHSRVLFEFREQKFFPINLIDSLNFWLNQIFAFKSFNSTEAPGRSGAAKVNFSLFIEKIIKQNRIGYRKFPSKFSRKFVSINYSEILKLCKLDFSSEVD